MVASVGLAALLVAGCGSASSPSTAKPVQAAGSTRPTAGAPDSTAAGRPAAGSGSGSGTLTVTGEDGATFHFDKVDCAGRKDPAGDLLVTATSVAAPDVTALISRSAGKPTVLLTVGATNPAMWADSTGADASTVSRTVDTLTVTAVPVERTGGLLSGKPTGTLTGTLTCANTAALT
ncbi:hypothetical protein [Kitasatospora sp. NPDC094011]|uniref:hypothetical protein n=1 Tax=Kitasatospora sp. NPDC094011 TaxID=3364090 RepID=UPI00382B8070